MLEPYQNLQNAVSWHIDDCVKSYLHTSLDFVSVVRVDILECIDCQMKLRILYVTFDKVVLRKRSSNGVGWCLCDGYLYNYFCFLHIVG